MLFLKMTRTKGKKGKLKPSLNVRNQAVNTRVMVSYFVCEFLFSLTKCLHNISFSDFTRLIIWLLCLSNPFWRCSRNALGTVEMLYVFFFHIPIKHRVSGDCGRGRDPSAILVLSLRFGDEPNFFCVYLVLVQGLIGKIMASMLPFV